MTVANFSGAEAEELRRAVGMRRSWERMKNLEGKLRAGMTTNGLDAATQENIIQNISSFALYGFSEIRPEWYLFPFGKPRPSDPTRPVTTLKTAWDTVRRNSKVTGRWHDHRHTLITDLAESGAGEQTIMDIAGHVSRNMLKHYNGAISRNVGDGVVEIGRAEK